MSVVARIRIILGLLLALAIAAPSVAGTDPIARGVAAKARSLVTNANPRPHTMAGFGHSRINQNSSIDTTSGNYRIRKASIGAIVQAEILSRGAFRYDHSLNFGVDGDTTTLALARVGAVIAANPGAVYIDLGVNDPPNAIPYATTIANLTAIYDAFRAAGIPVITTPIAPLNTLSGVTPVTAQTHKQLERISNWVRQQAYVRAGFYVIDATSCIADVSTGLPLGLSTAASTATLYDGLHPAPRGAYCEGRLLADVVPFIWPGNFRPNFMNATDLYDATYNPTGNRMANATAIPLGTSGGTASTGVSGAVPSGMTLGRQGGTTALAVGSFVNDALPNGQTQTKYQIVFTSPSGAIGDRVSLTNSNVTVAAGDTVYMSVDIEVSGITADSLQGIRVMLANSGQVYLSSIGDIRSGFVTTNVSTAGTYPTQGMPVPAGTTSVTPTIDFYLNGAVSSAGMTVKLSNMKVWTQ